MKKLLLLAGFLFVSLFAYSQDLIITKEGDSIRCKILEITSEKLYYSVQKEEGARNGAMSMDNILSYKYARKKSSSSNNVYVSRNRTTTPPPMSYSARAAQILQKDYSSLRLAFNLGYGYVFGESSEDPPEILEDHAERLRSGFTFGGDIGYYVSENFGIGLKVQMFKSSTFTDDIYFIDDDGNILARGTYRDDLNVFFFGPTFATRFFDRNKNNNLIINASLGYMSYTDNVLYIVSGKYTGSTLGACFDIGYDVGIADNLMLGFQVSAYVGALSQIRLSSEGQSMTGHLDNKEGLGRIDFTIGIRFR